MKVKKVSNLNLLDTFASPIHVSRTIKEIIDNKALSPISGHRWYKNIFLLIRDVRFFKIWPILVSLSKTYYFYTNI